MSAVTKVRLECSQDLRKSELISILNTQCNVSPINVYTDKDLRRYAVRVTDQQAATLSSATSVKKLKKQKITHVTTDREIKSKNSVFIKHLDGYIYEETEEKIKEEISNSNEKLQAVEVTKISEKTRTIKVLFENQKMVLEATTRGIKCLGLSIPATKIEKQRTPEVMQCYNCFQLGHKKDDCKKVTSCAKCGGEDHLRKDCDVEEPKCPLCKGGHVAFSLSCPSKYKKRATKEDATRTQRTPGASYASAVKGSTSSHMGNDQTSPVPSAHQEMDNQELRQKILQIEVVAFRFATSEEEYKNLYNQLCKENGITPIKIGSLPFYKNQEVTTTDEEEGTSEEEEPRPQPSKKRTNPRKNPPRVEEEKEERKNPSPPPQPKAKSSKRAVSTTNLPEAAKEKKQKCSSTTELRGGLTFDQDDLMFYMQLPKGNLQHKKTIEYVIGTVEKKLSSVDIPSVFNWEVMKKALRNGEVLLTEQNFMSCFLTDYDA